MEAIKEYLLYAVLAVVSSLLTWLVVPIGLEWLAVVASIAAIAGYAVGNSVPRQRRVRWIVSAAVIAALAVLVYELTIAYGSPGIVVSIVFAVCVLLVFLPLGMILRLSRLLRKDK